MVLMSTQINHQYQYTVLESAQPALAFISFNLFTYLFIVYSFVYSFVYLLVYLCIHVYIHYSTVCSGRFYVSHFARMTLALVISAPFLPGGSFFLSIRCQFVAISLLFSSSFSTHFFFIASNNNRPLL